MRGRGAAERLKKKKIIQTPCDRSELGEQVGGQQREKAVLGLCKLSFSVVKPTLLQRQELVCLDFFVNNTPPPGSMVEDTPYEIASGARHFIM